MVLNEPRDSQQCLSSDDTMFDNADPMQQNANSFEAENAQHNLLLLVNLVIKVNELISRQRVDKKSSAVFKKLFEIICNAWEEQTYKLSNALWNTFRHCGGTDLLIKNNCTSEYEIVQFSSDKFLKKNLTTETSDYVLKNVEEKVLRIVRKDKTQVSSLDVFKFNFRIFENLFKKPDINFIDINELDGLGAFLDEWRRRDFVSLEQTLNALFNLWRPYGCLKHQNCIIKHNVHTRFFTLMFKTEDNVKNYIAILVTDNEIRTAIIKRKIPTKIGNSNIACVRGQSQICIENRTPVLNSNSEETSKASEAGIKKQLDKTSVFGAINVIKPLEKVIVNDTASELADQSCRLIVEEVPYMLNMCVHQWSAEEVHTWFKSIGFIEFANNLLKNRVDGDLLLRLTIDELKNEIGILNGIMKKRFIRELNNLKQAANYSSIDTTDLNSFLKSISLEYSVYTYPMLIAGVTRGSMRFVTDDQLKNDCGISNGVHRNCIITSIKEMPGVCIENINKPYGRSVFISYHRSSDSLLASLIKVHLKIRGYNNVFLDVKRSNDAQSRHNVLQTIKQTKNFIVVLTPGSLDKQLMNSPAGGAFDVICEEVTTAKQGQCNVIPVLDNNFSWPPPALIPNDMKHLCEFNSIRWVHDYQDACVDKLETFMNQF